MFIENILTFIILSPIIGIILILFCNLNEKKIIKFIALNFSSLSFVCFLLLWSYFDKSTFKFQFINKIFISPVYNLNLFLGIDGISLFFLFLTTLLIPICILASWNSISFKLKEFLIAFLFLELLLIFVFCVLDILFFYVFFETVLIPMFLIIGVWGSRERKTLAAYYFFFLL